ncbi:Marvel domain [Fusarium oxysporum f. sp. vasinfectum]|nr:Marvel domain [Fusarium oxysporum f. sp. vasinfectum]
MAETGAAHKVISVLLRLAELACAIIVLGILSRFCYLAGIAQAHVDGRIIYAIVVACLGIIYSIFFCPPFKNMFLGFPFDFVLFVMWLVAYCLLQTRTGSHTCTATWYYNYWGYYWGRFWRVGPIGTVHVSNAGCAPWRTVLAFAFIAWFLHLLSGILGVYVFKTYIKLDETKRDIKHQAEKLTKPDPRVNYYHQGAVPQSENANNV